MNRPRRPYTAAAAPRGRALATPSLGGIPRKHDVRLVLLAQSI